MRNELAPITRLVLMRSSSGTRSVRNESVPRATTLRKPVIYQIESLGQSRICVEEGLGSGRLTSRQQLSDRSNGFVKVGFHSPISHLSFAVMNRSRGLVARLGSTPGVRLSPTTTITAATSWHPHKSSASLPTLSSPRRLPILIVYQRCLCFWFPARVLQRID